MSIIDEVGKLRDLDADDARPWIWYNGGSSSRRGRMPNKTPILSASHTIRILHFVGEFGVREEGRVDPTVLSAREP